MGSRGRNRKGLYVVLLFILELQYEGERLTKGNVPAGWHPSPRNRPNHFCFWVMDALSIIHGTKPRTFSELLGTLERLRLSNVALMLEHTVARRIGVANTGLLSLGPDTILARLGALSSAGERHPQARKFARVVSERLDARWQEAAEATARELLPFDDLPKMAFLLGALPPSFTVLNERIFSCLDDAELVKEHKLLTVLQFYGLVTGTLPPVQLEWRDAVFELGKLERRQLELLAGLSHSQIRELRRLGGDGWVLSMLRTQLRLSSKAWERLGKSLQGAAEMGAFDEKNLDIRMNFNPESSYFRSWEQLATLASSDLWEAVGRLDEEIVRMIWRGEIKQSFARRVASWSDSTWDEISDLLNRNIHWLHDYLEDCRTLEDLYRSRTGARLNLRGLFPKTCEWLDAFLPGNMEEALVGEVGDLETVASLVSQAIRERIWLCSHAVQTG